MAFTRSSLYQVGPGGNSPRLWMYSTADTVATVNTADYFLAAINELKVNDVLFVVSSTGGTPVVTINYVNSNTGTAIDVTDGMVVTATDTD